MDHNSRFPTFLHRAVDRLWPKKYLILVLYCAAVWAAILALLLASPTYEVTAIVSIKPGPLFVSDAEKIAAAPPEQFARPQITLLESETVIRRAISAVGAERLYPSKPRADHEPQNAKADFLGASTKFIFQSLEAPTRAVFQRLFPVLPVDDHAYINAKRHLTIRQEPQTDIIIVTFRNADPHVAVEFTNALVHNFRQRYFEVYSNTGAVDFFWEQKRKSEEAFARSSTALAEYSSKNGLFHIEEQRRLLLQQRSAMDAALLVTRGSIAEKESQAAAIPAQLAQMKQPLARSSQLRDMIVPKEGQAAVREMSTPPLSGIADDPPLLLVRVYQDTVASMVRTHTEVAGLHALEAQQEESLKGIEDQLTSMGEREAEFERLQLEVIQAKANAELFSKKAFEEQLAQDLNERKFTPVQVLQEATMPLEPIWPRPAVLLVLGFVLSVVPCLAAVVIRHALVNEQMGAAGRPALS
jgi:uncharacterized protein involved in exopolysaccharide biosynthesis